MSNNTRDKNKNQANPELGKATNKKIRTESLLSLAVNAMSPGNIERMSVCGSFMSFMANSDFSKKKLASANFCHNRFCPMCSWRQAKKDALKIDVLMRYVEEVHKKAFIFITLTVPNVNGNDLKNALDEFSNSFKRLIKLKEIKLVNKGYIRKLEITYNEERNDFHPHYHIVMAVDKNYFTDKSYISRDKWLKFWQEATRDFSITQVDIRRIKRESAGKEQNELAKYAAKDSDMVVSQDVFDVFYNCLKGRQVLTYNGLFTKANKMYKLKELDSYKEIDSTVYVYMILYQWGKGQYIETERRELLPSELSELNRMLIDEREVDD